MESLNNFLFPFYLEECQMNLKRYFLKSYHVDLIGKSLDHNFEKTILTFQHKLQLNSKLLIDPVPSPHLTSRDPIWIDNDQDIQDYGFKGNSSQINPYEPY